MKTIYLNVNEQLVYDACVEAEKIYEEGGYFGFEDIKTKFKVNVLKGYISSLVKKGLIETLLDGYYFDYRLTDESYEI